MDFSQCSGRKRALSIVPRVRVTFIVYFKLLFVKIGFVVAKLQLRSEKRLKKKWKLTYFIRKSFITVLTHNGVEMRFENHFFLPNFFVFKDFLLIPKDSVRKWRVLYESFGILIKSLKTKKLGAKNYIFENHKVPYK